MNLDNQTVDALKLVVELAEGNMLSDREIRDAPELFHEQERQATSIAHVRATMLDAHAKNGTASAASAMLAALRVGDCQAQNVRQLLAEQADEDTYAATLLEQIDAFGEHARAVIKQAEAAGITVDSKDDDVHAVNKVREYNVQLRRTMHAYATVSVIAASPEEAIVLARDVAPTHRFKINKNYESLVNWAHAENADGEPEYADWEG